MLPEALDHFLSLRLPTCLPLRWLSHAAQVTLPLAMLASAELEGVGVRVLGGPETITCRAERMIRSWSKLQNGGYGGREQRAFQET